MVFRKSLKLLIVLIFTFIGFQGFSQFSVNGGLTIANSLVKSNQISVKSGVSIFTGVGYEFKLFKNEDFSLSTEAIYTSRAYTLIYSDNRDSKKISDEYITFPILLNYKIKNAVKLSGGFELGGPIASTFRENEYEDGWFAFLAQIQAFPDEYVSPYFRTSISPMSRLKYQQVDQYGYLSEETGEFKNIYFMIGLRVKFKK
ncbi:outer membrane beta-barrel protein [Marinigracilibium pacificum]|uniref:Outer membrane beta-barrel protein n=1 Tax=Marinigracilibium pacificum TaxID=2729599 RepID=A0A848IWF5_9BACT|nr:outer membrane beta-barrel protein [Marinigracilibium pacificum]NMM47498.1 outer membrane beta-barrel protein [Marinigracilibium pacificum]